jgi:hypothetical protein
MRQVIKHYVRELSQGAFVSETDSHSIISQSEYEPPKRAYAFQFYDKTVIEKDGEDFYGKEINTSKWHYINARILSLEDIGKEYGASSILHQNVALNGYSFAIENRFHSFQSAMLETKDEIVLVTLPEEGVRG